MEDPSLDPKDQRAGAAHPLAPIQAGSAQAGSGQAGSTARLAPTWSSEQTLSPPGLLVEGLTKDYSGTQALDGLSFRLERGRILGMVGPNGAGKTTALRSIAGILPIKEGRVHVCGHDVAKEEVAAKRCLGWVPDDPEPFDALTVWEHLEFTAALFRVKNWKARAEDLLERFELTVKRDALGGELSRGMRQKLAFSCAWLPKPQLVLLDEPLSGLDPRGIRSAKEAIRELASGGTSVLLSSHLLDLIEALADEILILDGGRSIFTGSLVDARQRLSAQGGSSLEEIFFAATGNSERVETPEEAQQGKQPGTQNSSQSVSEDQPKSFDTPQS